MKNGIVLQGTVHEWKVLRYTVTGLPVAEGILHYKGIVVEAKKDRQLDFLMPFIMVGEKAVQFAGIPLGTAVSLQGFIAPVSKMSVKHRLHIQAYQTI